MIVIFKDDKIYAVDKNLLQNLNITLENLNTVLSSIKLGLSYLENRKISIQNREFNINQIDILSVDNLKVFDLQEASEVLEDFIPIEPVKDLTQNDEITLNIENFQKPATSHPSIQEITPQIEKEPQFDISINDLQPYQSIEETTPKIQEDHFELNFKEPEISPLSAEEISPQPKNEPQFDLNLKEHSQNIEVQYQTPQQNENIKPVEENIIKINFENDYDEISKMLSMNKEEIQKLIKEDLEKASKDLGIDINTLSTLTNDLIKQINDNKNKFYEAIEKHDYKKLHELAHSLKGAALNLRLSNIALILKYIDEKSKAKENIDTIKYLIDKFYNFIDNIQPNSNKTYGNINIKTTPKIKNLIIKTLKHYTATQNRKKLKKDLQYIEKILGIKIDSIEELQNIIKGM